MTLFFQSTASKTTKAFVAVAFLAALYPLTAFAQQASRSPFVNTPVTQKPIPNSLKGTLEKVGFASFDIRVLQNPYFFQQTGLNRATQMHIDDCIAQAVSTAKSNVGAPPVQPRVFTPEGTQFYLERVKDYHEGIPRMINRQIREIATPRFLQSGLMSSDLDRLRQVWLQVTGPNSDVLRDLNVSAAQLLTIENQLNEVRATARKAGNDEAVYRASASGIKEALKASLRSSQWSLWTQLIGKEVETN